MDKYVLRKANIDEVDILTRISKEAFDTDIDIDPDLVGGPPDYDNYDWHLEMYNKGRLYTFLNGDEIVGGSVLFIGENYAYIERVFIAPNYQRKGLGFLLMEYIEKMLEEIKTFKLDTPTCNYRTNNLYKKCGYVITKIDGDTTTYIKNIK